MSDSLSSHSTPSIATRRRPRVTLTHPMFPEGIVSPVLLIALVTLAGYSVESSDWARIVTPIGVIAFLSALFGCVVAKLRVLDSLAHLLSIFLAFAVSTMFAATRATAIEGSLRDRAREIARDGVNWYLGDAIDEEMEALLVSLLMGIIVWLVGYLAAWSMFRRGWVLSAIFLPGFLILVNLGYADEPETWYLAAFAVLALILTARHNIYSRQREWRRLRMPGPAGLTHRFLVGGVVVALVATMIGWRAPSSLSQATLQPLMGEISTQALSLQDRAASWLQDVNGSPAGEQVVSGSYTSFGDSFAVGGPLNLSDAPQVLVSADTAPYLTAQHYDSYSGRGWYSTTDETFVPEGPDGRRYSPAMTFGADQEVPLTGDVTGSRHSEPIDISPLAPMGNRVLTVDTYLSSSVQSAVRMSWIQMDDEVFDVAEGEISALPQDLQRMASLLAAAELTGDDDGTGPEATDADDRDAIDAEREALRGRFLDVRWTADDSGAVQTLIVTGQAPVYDDVESVSSSDSAVVDGTYRVIASSSLASAEELHGAGTAYPDWVSQRYLSLPDTITPQTVDLTQAITSATDNPYDMARAIEAYLRANYAYDETVEAPPEGADIVDYFLFERKRGYCEYYASAMTVMLRSIGVPARVAVGFYPGDYDESRDGFLYRQANAHAWTEVFFPGYGWIPFEPTSPRALITEQTDPGEPPVTPESTNIAVEETPLGPTPTIEASPGAGEDGQGQLPPQPIASDDGGPSGLTLALLGSGLAMVGLALVGWALWSLPLRGLSLPGSLYARLQRVGRWLGVAPPATATPKEFGRAFVERIPQAQPHVDRIVHIYEIDQYGPERASGRWLQGGEQAWRTMRSRLPRWLFRWRR
jgi:transglutaminase-like putative cysteine protease